MALPAMQNNIPSAGHISWDAFHIQYLGVGYAVAAGETSDRWVWWEFNAGVPTIETGPVVPDLLADDLLLFGNRNGIAVRMQNATLVDGELIVDGSILADAIAANQITSDHITVDGLDAAVIKFGVMSGERIDAHSITALEIAAHTITALQISADTITANEIAADTITANEIAADTITANEIAANAVTASEIAADAVTSDKVLANSIQAKHLDVEDVSAAVINTKILQSQLAITGSLTIADTNQGWSKDGLYVGDNVAFYPDSRTNRVEGDFVTQNLSVKDGLSIGGNGDVHGTIVAANGVPTPTGKMSLGQTWPKLVAAAITNDGTTDISNIYQDMIEFSSTQWITSVNYFGAQFRKINKSDGSWAGDLVVGAWGTNFFPNGGITKIGTDYYIIGSDKTRNGDYYVYRISATASTKVAEWRITVLNGFDGKRVRLITDGTNVGMIWTVPSNGNLTLRWYNPGLTAQVGADIVLQAAMGDAHVGAAYYGIAQVGGTARIWVSMHTGDSNMVRCWTTAGVRVATEDFPRAANATVQGLCYDSNGANQRMVSFDKYGNFYTYSLYNLGGTLNAQQTYYDGDNAVYPAGTIVNGVDVSGLASGLHETPPSPVTSFALGKRAWPVITATPAPDELVTSSTQVDKADRLGIYASVGGTPMFQAYLAKGVRNLPVTDQLLTAAPAAGASAVPTFATASVPSPGRHRSAAEMPVGSPIWDLQGSGPGRMGHSKWDLYGRPMNHGEYITSNTASTTTGITTKRLGWTLRDPTNSPSHGISYAAGGDFTISQSGLYLLSACVAWAATGTNRRIVVITLNGTSVLRSESYQTAGQISAPVTGVVYLPAGSVLAVSGVQYSGGNLAFVGTDESNFFMIHCLAAF